MILSVPYTAHDLDRYLTERYPVHCALCVGIVPGGFIPAVVRHDYRVIAVAERLDTIYATPFEALQAGLRTAKEVMGDKWLLRDRERFSRN